MSGSPEDREIGRLEAEVDGLRQRAERAERILAGLRADRESLSSQLQNCTYDRNGWKRRAERFERILAALREPSENVSKAVWSTWGLWDSQNHFAATLHALVRAAVAAAEQEVGG